MRYVPRPIGDSGQMPFTSPRPLVPLKVLGVHVCEALPAPLSPIRNWLVEVMPSLTPTALVCTLAAGAAGSADMSTCSLSNKLPLALNTPTLSGAQKLPLAMGSCQPCTCRPRMLSLVSPPLENAPAAGGVGVNAVFALLPAMYRSVSL